MVSYKLSVNIRFIRFVLLTLEIVHVQSAFRHDVTPSCKATDEECTFDFHINYIMSMVAYNRTSLQGFPVYSNNGALFKRTALPEGNPSHCCGNTPLSKKGMWFVMIHQSNSKRKIKDMLVCHEKKPRFIYLMQLISLKWLDGLFCTIV